MRNDFTSMTDFLTNAAEGDIYAEPKEKGSRAMHTYRMVQRLAAGESAFASRGTGGMVETLTTQHIGRAQIAGRPEYTYLTTLTTNETYADGQFIHTAYGTGRDGRNGVVSTRPAPRMNAKVLATEHGFAAAAAFRNEPVAEAADNARAV